MHCCSALTAHIHCRITRTLRSLWSSKVADSDLILQCLFFRDFVVLFLRNLQAQACNVRRGYTWIISRLRRTQRVYLDSFRWNLSKLFRKAKWVTNFKMCLPNNHPGIKLYINAFSWTSNDLNTRDYVYSTPLIVTRARSMTLSLPY